jgi:Cysteine-rich CPCC
MGPTLTRTVPGWWEMGEVARYACPCCGNLTLDESPPGTFDICPVCFWEDDDAQFNDPTYAGGANKISLLEARSNYARLLVSKPRFKTNVRRPRPEEVPPPG